MIFTTQEIEIICKRMVQIDDAIDEIAKEKAGNRFFIVHVEIGNTDFDVLLSDYQANEEQVKITYQELTEIINQKEKSEGNLMSGFYFKIVCSCNYTENFYTKFGQPFNFQCPKCGKLQGFIGRDHAN